VLDAGVSLIDTAPIYGVAGPGFGEVERRLGDAFAASPGLRERCVLVTKAGIEPGKPYDSSSAALAASCEASLSRLRTDRIDLFLVHRPDNLASHADVASALDGLIASGKVRAVGVSNYRPDQVRALRAHLDAPLVVNQIEVSATMTDAMFDGALDQCEEIGIAPMAWSPLGGGAILSPRDERSQRVAAALDVIAVANGTSRDVAALGWLLAHPSGMVPVLGTTRPERARAATAALDLRIERRHWYDVLEAALGRPMP
jgi:predicted oxidoreductase